VYATIVKPTFDFLVAGILFVVLLPVFIIVTFFLAISLKGNPFFTQIRPGKNEVLFKIIKFRSMSNEKNASGVLLPDEARLSGFGSLVRKTSLDELPQLINVIKSDMSIVGPRPLLPEYLPLYSKDQKKRHLVRPGITGYAQVNGRNAISWEKKFELDVYYVNHQSFTTDFRILLNTVQKVIRRSDINTANMATTERFKGTI